MQSKKNFFHFIVFKVQSWASFLRYVSITSKIHLLQVCIELSSSSNTQFMSFGVNLVKCRSTNVNPKLTLVAWKREIILIWNLLIDSNLHWSQMNTKPYVWSTLYIQWMPRILPFVNLRMRSFWTSVETSMLFLVTHISI